MHTCTHAHLHTCTHAHLHTCTLPNMHTCTLPARYSNVPSLQEERSQGEIATAAMASINQFLSKQAGQPPSNRQMAGQPPSNRQMAGQPPAQPPHHMGQGMGQQDLSANPYFQVRQG